jgi:hypothetical protein
MLIKNWREVLTRAWSARLMILAALFSGAEVALPYCTTLVPPGAMAALSLIVVSGAFIMRLIAQKNMEAGNGESSK